MKFYKGLLKNAWEIVSRNKFLWLFGFFVVLLGENGGEYEFYIRNVQKFFQQDSIFNPYYWLTDGWAAQYYQLQSFLSTGGVLAWVFIFGLIIAFLIVVAFVMVSQASIIHVTDQARSGNDVGFYQAINSVKKKIIPVFGMNLLSKISVYLSLFIIGIPLLYLLLKTDSQAYYFIYVVIGIIVLIPFGIIITFLIKYAINYIVLKEESFFSALLKAWHLFEKNWVITLEMALVIFFINIIISFLVMIVLLIFFGPYLYFSIIDVGVTQSWTAFGWILLIIGLCAILAMVLVGSIFSAFQWSAWTLLFDDLTKGQATSRIVNWTEKRKQAKMAKMNKEDNAGV
ncbi:MAG: hypothetical protein ABH835_01490 [Patescibacteria group bacterium]|nr:hypothetical protein [Patescibacteria group bacterium]